MVLDSSALLAFLLDEPGANEVEQALEQGSACSTANWSEVAQKVLGSGGSWAAARALLLSYGLTLEPVTSDDAVMAARRWRRGSGLSLADRLCLALGERTGDVILTADSAWGEQDGVRLIRQ